MREWDDEVETSGRRDPFDRSRIRQSFTLIELLVAVAVIAILISLLLPVLNRAKVRATEVVCLSQCRQHYLAYTMYAEDNDSRWPRRAFGAAGWDWQWSNESDNLDFRHQVESYIEPGPVYWCPFRPQDEWRRSWPSHRFGKEFYETQVYGLYAGFTNVHQPFAPDGTPRPWKAVSPLKLGAMLNRAVFGDLARFNHTTRVYENTHTAGAMVKDDLRLNQVLGDGSGATYSGANLVKRWAKASYTVFWYVEQ